MLEKRRYGRLAINLPVILRHGGKIIPATALNISSGGMFIQVERSKIQSGRPVEVIFDLDEADRDISMRGQVIRIEDIEDQRGIGVQFTNLFSLSHRTVQQYVKQHLN